MAASLITQSHDLTNCTKCHQLLQYPRSIPCLHSYCTSCLEEHVKDTEKVKCIECGEVFDFPPGGLKEWQPLAIVHRLTQQKAMQMKLMSEETIHCTACVGDNGEEERDTKSASHVAIARCTVCNDYLCKRCVTIHKMQRIMMNHPVVTLEELRAGKFPRDNAMEQKMCAKHKGEALLFYCETCDVPICRQCVVITHHHPEHKQVELEQAAKYRGEQLQQLQESCGKNKEEVKKALQDIREKRHGFDVAVSDARSQIKDTVQKLKSSYLKRLDEAQKATEEELGTVEKKGLESFKTVDNQLISIMSRTETAETLSEVLKESGSEFEVASDYGSVKAVLQDMVEVETSSIINAGKDFTEVKFEENTDQDVSKIVIGRVTSQSARRKRDAKKGGGVLKTEFGNVGNESLVTAIDVALTPGGDVAVTDYGNAKIKIFNPDNGGFKYAFNVNVGIDAGKSSDPWCIQVGPDNMFYVTDIKSPYVKIFDIQGTYKRYFHTVSPDNVAYNTHGSSILCELAINSNQQVLAGNYTHNFISCHSLDGTHLKSIKVTIKPYFLAVTSKESIVVSPYTSSEVQIIDETGNILTSLQTPTGFSSWYPSGIVVSKRFCTDDGEDEVLIADRSNGHVIHRYSASGKYIDCVTNAVSNIYSLTLSTNEGPLFVADRLTVRCFEI